MLRRLVGLVVALASVAAAQTVNNSVAVGSPEAGSFSGSDIENVQINNGNLHIQIPLWKYAGRGLSTSTSFVYNSKGFERRESCDVNSNCTYNFAPEQGHSMILSLATPLSWQDTYQPVLQGCLGSSTQYPTHTNRVVREPDGTKHQMIPATTSAYRPDCWLPNSTQIYSTDGSGFIASTSKHGTVDSSLQVTDSNGNYLAKDPNTGAMTDTLGRTIPSDGSYYDSSGTLRHISVNYITISVTTHLCASTQNSACSDYAYPGSPKYWTVPQTMMLPNGLTFGFEYNTGVGGEITAINLPTGGRIEYTWVDGPTDDTGGRRVATRTVITNGQRNAWSYNYASITGGQTITVTDPLGNYAVHTCQQMATAFSDGTIDPSCYVTRVEYHTAGGTLLKTVTTDYTTGGAVAPIRETTTLNDVSPPITSRTETDYDGKVIVTNVDGWTGRFTWKNPTEVREFGFDGGLVRRTAFTYLHTPGSAYEAANIADRVTSKTVYHTPSTDTTTPPDEQTFYSYDGSGLAPTSGVPNHAYRNTVRGNLTQVRRWRNTDNSWLYTDNTYDDLGNLLSTTDPGNAMGSRHTTNFDYSDRWLGNGCVQGNTRAFVTRTTNALSQNTQKTYYPCTGFAQAVADQNDLNAGRLGTTYSYDYLNRLASTTAPDGGQTTLDYHLDVLPLTVTKTQSASPAPDIVTSTIRDDLGRVKRTSLDSDSEGITYTDTSYDALGRLASVSNPYRSTAELTYGITQTSYDALGRVTAITKPDSGLVHTDYSGNITTITDEAGKQRRSYTDALGRLIQVDEPGQGLTSGSAAVPATGSAGSASVSGSIQSKPDPNSPATHATGTVALSGSERSMQVQTQAAAPGNGSVTINGSVQSRPDPNYPATHGTGTVTVSGSERSTQVLTQAATQATGSITISGAPMRKRVYDPGCDCLTDVENNGQVYLSVNGHTDAVWYGAGTDTAASIAGSLASVINGDSAAPVTASVSGSVVYLASKAYGASTNYSLSTWSDYWTDYFTSASFNGTLSGTNLTGGQDAAYTTVYDTGTLTVTVGGTSKSASYNSGSSTSSIAGDIASQFNNDGASSATAVANGANITFTSRAVGASTNYAVSASWGTTSGYFSGSSFAANTPASLTGGQDQPTLYDSGTVSVVVGSYTAQANYANGDTSSSIAMKLRDQLNLSSSPVAASASGATVSFTSKASGAASNYGLSSSSTYQTTYFGSPSFTGSPSGSSLTGGHDTVYTTVYDTGSATITVGSTSKTANYDSNSTTSTIASDIAAQFTNDGASSATAVASGANITFTSRAVGASTNYAVSSSASTTNGAYFSGTSFSLSTPANLSGGHDQPWLYDSGTVSLVIGAYTAQVNYANGDTSSSVAAKLRDQLNLSSSPVTASASGATVSFSSKGTGAATNYALSWSASTGQPQSFSSPSFSVSPSGGAMTGGTDGSPAIPPAPNGVWSLTTLATTLYSYDTLGNLKHAEQHPDPATGGDSSTYRNRDFAYDSLSRLLSARNPETGRVCYGTVSGSTCDADGYDPDGNLLYKTDARGITINYSPSDSPIDALHRVTKKTYSNGEPAVSYFYDQGSYNGLPITNGQGRRTGMSDASGVTAWSYDEMGREVTQQRTIGSVPRTISQQFNKDGSLYKVTYPSGRTVTYSNNGAGRPLSAGDNYGNTYASNATYAAPGGVAGLLSNSVIQTTNTYNKRLQPITLSASSPGQTVLSLSYDFHLGNGNNGNVYQIVNNRDNNRTQSFTYDALNRLLTAQTSASNLWGDGYVYDPWGNLLQKNPIKGTAETFAATVNGNNQLQGYSYDAAGNLLNDGLGHAMTYDAKGRVSGAAGVTYTYDGDGNRVQKSNGTLYWGEGPLAESDLSGNIQHEYVFFGGKRLARLDLPSGAVHYYFSDHLGTADVVTNSSGLIENESDYYPWGGERVITQNLANQNYKFTGKERDSESSLDYFGTRFYGSAIGRFLRADEPFADQDPNDPQSWNLYTYAANNPIRYTDADGQAHTDDNSFWVGDYDGECGDQNGKTLCWNASAGNGQGEWETFQTDQEKGQEFVDDMARLNSLSSWSEVGVNGIAGAQVAEGISELPSVAGWGIDVLKSWRLGVKMAGARAKGAAGEAAAGIVKNTERIDSATGTAAYRVPDELDHSAQIIGETKNISGKISLTNQIKDDIAYAQQHGYTFVLRVRNGTQFTKPLQNLIAKGIVKVITF